MGINDFTRLYLTAFYYTASKTATLNKDKRLTVALNKTATVFIR